jgi:hypothetical protein
MNKESEWFKLRIYVKGIVGFVYKAELLFAPDLFLKVVFYLHIFSLEFSFEMLNDYLLSLFF